MKKLSFRLSNKTLDPVHLSPMVFISVFNNLLRVFLFEPCSVYTYVLQYKEICFCRAPQIGLQISVDIIIYCTNRIAISMLNRGKIHPHTHILYHISYIDHQTFGLCFPPLFLLRIWDSNAFTRKFFFVMTFLKSWWKQGCICYLSDF